MGSKSRIPPPILRSARENWRALEEFIAEHGRSAEAMLALGLFTDLDDYPDLNGDQRIQWTTGWFRGVADVYGMVEEKFLKRYVL